MKRYLEQSVLMDLSEKMVFIGGPRQVGKTYFGRDLAKRYFKNPQYLNWDIDADRRKILNLRFSPENDLLLFDEIHKYANWKNHIKGIFDQDTGQKIMVTGSARLDLYRKGGDSMLGRYHYHRLHPISLAEACGKKDRFDIEAFEKNFKLHFPTQNNEVLDDLMEFGGFPEPYLKKNHRFLRRWHNERKTRLVREDIRDIEFIREFSLLQVLVDLLPSKVGAIFSINALREDLNIAHQTIAKWLDILENFYYCFRIYPYYSSAIKSLKKEPKLFLWDYSEVPDHAIRFENLIGSHLLKFVHYLYDSFGMHANLNYLRDVDKREVDFVLIIDNQPVVAIEVKSKSQKISTALKYFKRKLRIPFVYQVVREEDIDFLSLRDNIRVISAGKFLSAFV